MIRTFIISVSLAFTVVAGSEYSQWRGSPARDGMVGEAAAVFANPTSLSLAEAWKIPMPGGGDGNYSSAVIAADTVYARVSRNPDPDDPKSRTLVEELFRLNLVDGTVVWQKQLATVKAGACHSTPCATDGLVITVLSDGTVCAVDQERGEVRWQQSVAPSKELLAEWKEKKLKRKASYNASPTLVDGKVIVGTYQLCALDVTTGAIAWQQEKAGSGNGSPVVWRHGDKAYVFAGRSLVDLADGSVIWSIQDGYGDTTPCITGDTLALVAAGNKAKKTKGSVLLLRVSPERAEEIVRIPATSATSLATDGQHFFFRSGSERYCVAVADGKVVWKSRKPATVGNLVSSTMLVGGTMITWAAPEKLPKDGSAPSQQIGFYHKADGKEIAVCEVPDLGYGSFPAISGDRIVFRGWKNLWCYQVKP